MAMAMAMGAESANTNIDEENNRLCREEKPFVEDIDLLIAPAAGTNVVSCLKHLKDLFTNLKVELLRFVNASIQSFL